MFSKATLTLAIRLHYAVQESDNTDTWSREEVLNLLGRKSIHKWSKDRSREDMDAQSGS